MAGPARTTSIYGGAFDPNVKIESVNGWSGGIELMRMGRNIGIGGGVHYVQYAERLHAPDIMRTTEQQVQYYFMSTLDTTILMITDSLLINGEYYHTGSSANVTINVIQQGLQTVSNTERIREARMRINRTSYLEVPLLLDAHLTQGRWQLGLRGGPTAGVLTFRRGSIPDDTGDGYVDLEDRQFRSLVLGYTARAYIRHRFNAGWSAGLEPMLRGHLTNGLEGEGLVRRPSALGGMFSLTYRFH
jgi:hypothetical protein